MSRCSLRRLWLGLTALCLAAAAAGAQTGPVPLVFADRQVLLLRVPDTLNGRIWTVPQRIDHALDIVAKYLGSDRAALTTRSIRSRVHFYLNGEFVLAATPSDAKAAGYKDTAKLATAWKKALESAIAEGRAAR